jgi:hypothetical protein
MVGIIKQKLKLELQVVRALVRSMMVPCVTKYGEGEKTANLTRRKIRGRRAQGTQSAPTSAGDAKAHALERTRLRKQRAQRRRR